MAKAQPDTRAPAHPRPQYTPSHHDATTERRGRRTGPWPVRWLERGASHQRVGYQSRSLELCLDAMNILGDLKRRFQVHDGLVDLATDRLEEVIGQTDQDLGSPDLVLAKQLVLLRGEKDAMPSAQEQADPVPACTGTFLPRRPSLATPCQTAQLPF